MRKLLSTKSHDSEVPTSVQCRIIKYRNRNYKQNSKQKLSFDKKPLFKCSFSGNMVKILEKHIQGCSFWFIFSCRPASLLQNKLLRNCF